VEQLDNPGLREEKWPLRQGSHASWKVLDFFWIFQALENQFGPGKSWN